MKKKLDLKRMNKINEIAEDKLDKDVDSFTFETIRNLYKEVFEDTNINKCPTLELKSKYIAQEISIIGIKKGDLEDIIECYNERRIISLIIALLLTGTLFLGNFLGFYFIIKLIITGLGVLFGSYGILCKIIEDNADKKVNTYNTLIDYYTNLLIATENEIHQEKNSSEENEKDHFYKTFELENVVIALNYQDAVFNLNIYNNSDNSNNLKLSRNKKNQKH